jgi:hypothetical protein
MKKNNISDIEALSQLNGIGSGHVKLTALSTYSDYPVCSVRLVADGNLTYTWAGGENRGDTGPITIALPKGELFLAPMVDVSASVDALLVLK